MITARELRIGNFVADRGGKTLTIDRFYGNKIECDVKGMPQKDPHTGIKLYYHPFTEEIDFLHPIPLTEEWLESAGFVEVPSAYPEQHPWSSWEKDGVEIKMPYFEFTFCEGQYEVETKYVHQLQNLYFALTGQELEFNNK